MCCILLVGPEIVVTAVTDRFKNLPRREILYIIVCLLCYFLAFPTISQGGIAVKVLFRAYDDIILKFYFYTTICFNFKGARRLAKNIFEMTGSAPHLFIVLCWYMISPLIIIISTAIVFASGLIQLIHVEHEYAIWIFSSVKYKPFTFGTYIYPTWAVLLAWIIAILPVICIPIGMIHAIYRTPSRSIIQKIRQAVQPIETPCKEVTKEELTDF
ncbi:hypothetical protein KUTeg_011887, partial [Tegillarca granosa]